MLTTEYNKIDPATPTYNQKVLESYGSIGLQSLLQWLPCTR